MSNKCISHLIQDQRIFRREKLSKKHSQESSNTPEVFCKLHTIHHHLNTLGYIFHENVSKEIFLTLGAIFRVGDHPKPSAVPEFSLLTQYFTFAECVCDVKENFTASGPGDSCLGKHRNAREVTSALYLVEEKIDFLRVMSPVMHHWGFS